MTVAEAAAALRARKVSSAELTEQAIGSIADQNGTLNAFITVTATEARAAADQADRKFAQGIDLGPLQGIPIALKDVFNTKDDFLCPNGASSPARGAAAEKPFAEPPVAVLRSSGSPSTTRQ